MNELLATDWDEVRGNNLPKEDLQCIFITSSDKSIHSGEFQPEDSFGRKDVFRSERGGFYGAEEVAYYTAIQEWMVKKNENLANKIKNEIVSLLTKFGVMSDIISVINSCNDTLSDEQILSDLKSLNEGIQVSKIVEYSYSK